MRPMVDRGLYQLHLKATATALLYLLLFVCAACWLEKRKAKLDFSGSERLPKEYETMASMRGKNEGWVFFFMLGIMATFFKV